MGSCTLYGRVFSRLIALACAAGLVYALAIYPSEGTALPYVLLAYIILLAWRPGLWLLVLPALLPNLDLAPQTGWFFLEEIDLLLLATGMFCYWRGPADCEGVARLRPFTRIALAVLGVSLLGGIWRGAYPFPPIDANAFTNYLSPYNALRVAKGWLWALFLLPPLRWTAGAQLQGLQKYFVPGMLVGLALVCAAEIRERILFPGLLNFSADYRASAPFSAMHTGGAALDGYLALSVPLLAMWLRPGQHPLRMGTALILACCAGYASLSTFSRGLYFGLAVAGLIVGSRIRWRISVPAVLAFIALAYALQSLFARIGYRALGLAVVLIALVLIAAAGARRIALRSGAMALLALFGLALLIPFADSDYAAERFSTMSEDLDGRMQHWRGVLHMLKGDATTVLFGNGLGTFPALYFWNNAAHEQPASYRFNDERFNRYLKLFGPAYPAGYGELLRYLQRVDVVPDHPYLLSLDVRTSGPQAFLHLNLCERQLLYPRACIAAPINLVPTTLAWRRYRFPLRSGLLATPTNAGTPPVQLEIAEEGEHSAIEIDNVSLLDQLTERELIRNGGFSEANSHWFFSSDHYHLPWHIKNLALNLYFELGVLGLLATSILLLSALTRLLRRHLQRDAAATAWLASLAAFLCVGLFDSLVDVPRLTLLFMLVLSAVLLQAKGNT